MQHLVTDTWYAVQRSANLGKRPMTTERLGRRHVVWRADGDVHAAPAQCPHRGADLGADTVEDGCLARPCHGIRYASDGAATIRPAVGPDETIPNGAHLRTIPADDAHGYVWIWHGTDRLDRVRRRRHTGRRRAHVGRRELPPLVHEAGARADDAAAAASVAGHQESMMVCIESTIRRISSSDAPARTATWKPARNVVRSSAR